MANAKKTKAHGCIERLNAMLAERNTELDLATAIPRDAALISV